jgi:hypothetical protein
MTRYNFDREKEERERETVVNKILSFLQKYTQKSAQKEIVIYRNVPADHQRTFQRGVRFSPLS